MLVQEKYVRLLSENDDHDNDSDDDEDDDHDDVGDDNDGCAGFCRRTCLRSAGVDILFLAGGISERRLLRQPLSLGRAGACGALEASPSPCYCWFL